MAKDVLVRAPLFDRLAGGGPRVLDRRGVLESVRRELELLFNTRSGSPAHRPDGAPLTVLDYGIPALSDFAAANPSDRRALEAALLAAVQAFEPRLGSVRLAVLPPAGDGTLLTVAIDALLVAETICAPVTFVCELDPGSGKGTVHAQQ